MNDNSRKSNKKNKIIINETQEKIIINEEDIDKTLKFKITEQDTNKIVIKEDDIIIRPPKTTERVILSNQYQYPQQQPILPQPSQPIPYTYNQTEKKNNFKKFLFVLIPGVSLIAILIFLFLLRVPNPNNYEKNNFNEIINQLEKEIKNNPKDLEKTIELSNIYILNNDADKSYDLFKKVLELNPQDEYAKSMIKVLDYIKEVE